MTQHKSSLSRRALTIPLFAIAVTLMASAALAQPAPPQNWSSANVGGGRGAWSYGDDGFTVEGTGTDIWGTADSFFYAYQQLAGDGEFRARISNVTGTEPWTKVGLMLRFNPTDPSSPHHFLLASKGKGLAYQRRLGEGANSLNTPLSSAGAPEWFRMVRTGAKVVLGMSSDGVNWRTVSTITWPTGPTYIGIAVTSHDTTSIGKGFLDGLAVTGNGTTPPFVDVINPQPGDTVQATAPYTIQWQANATGIDLDHFDLYLGLEQDGAITYEPLSGCTNLPADARQCVWPSPGPRTDAAHILVVATDRMDNQGEDDSGRFSIESAQTGTLPAGWSSQDVGAVSAGGSASGDGSNFTVTGSGADVWGTADEFHFAHVEMTGDFSITAQVVSVQNVNQWTKAGLMIRESLSPDSRHGFAIATPTTVKGTAFQYRDAAGQTSGNVPGPAFAPPVWLKLVKRGPTITSYYRHNITDPWTRLNYQVYSGFADTVEAGLAVSSHVDGQLATAQFSDVVVESLPPWTCALIASSGSCSTDGTIFNPAGQGSDIWGTADSLAGFFVPWVGDGTMTARVWSLPDSDDWAKAGVMFRESLTPGSKHVFALVSPGHGLNVQYRPETGGQSVEAPGGGKPGAAPLWIRMTRSGDSFVAESSTDGRTWTSIGSATVQLGQSLYVGIAHTTHNPSYSASSAGFDDLRITR